jgi:hypothetical protein
VDRSAVERVLVEHLPALSQALGLSQWHISLGYDAALSTGDNCITRGECSRLLDYQSAHITLNPDVFADAEAVLATLRHELFHVVLAPFDLYTSAVDRLDLSDDATELLERIRDHATEQCVAALERLYEGLKGGEE